MQYQLTQGVSVAIAVLRQINQAATGTGCLRTHLCAHTKHPVISQRHAWGAGRITARPPQQQSNNAVTVTLLHGSGPSL